ncbi:hypothetical protein [Saccharothrix sp.]|uniref:hypothetical protein n=1 Tax=Saccharothrix sp. TaxID=1873460 RepID=UPI0028111B92|nr:hypothetical protein [Saccharothrix sp.]
MTTARPHQGTEPDSLSDSAAETVTDQPVAHPGGQAGSQVTTQETLLELRVRALEEETEHTTEAVDDVRYAVEVLAGVDGRLRADLAQGLAEIGRWATWLSLRVAHEDALADGERPEPAPDGGPPADPDGDPDGDGR